MKRINLIYTFSISFMILIGLFATYQRQSNLDESIVVEGKWVDQSRSIEALTKRADLIVRAKVLTTVDRQLEVTLPRYDENNKIDGVGTFSSPYTDSTFQVISIIKGKADPTITIMQNGGQFIDPITKKTGRQVMVGDPIYLPSTEHILFLVDISNDGIHSKGRKLYRTINPLGRFEVKEADQVEVPITKIDIGVDNPQFPKTASEVVTQIHKHLNP